MSDYEGILCIGDPHLASRVPGFRRDDYPTTMLGKLRWSLSYARERSLLPVLLGDLFNWPRDNANRLLVELLELCRNEVLAIPGNHDSVEDSLSEDDSLSILAAAGRLHLLSEKDLWRGRVRGVEVVVGGTPWGRPLPERFEREKKRRASLVCWITHHDIAFLGYPSAQLFPVEIPGIDLVINGHIHRPLPERKVGSTLWMNPGGIARVSRSDASRSRKPSVLQIDIETAGAFSTKLVEVPHRPFDEVFHPELRSEPLAEDTHSLFVRGLAELETQRTSTGAGLQAFLERNLHAFEPDVAEEVRRLAREVLHDGDGAQKD